MAKKRIYDLAKEYGLSGQELAKKLRDLGFGQVKSHMTALDDFEVLQIQGVLEAHGIISESRGEADDTGGGLILRKKKKKRKAPTHEPKPAVVEAEPEPEPEPAAQTEPEPGPAPEPVRQASVEQVAAPLEPVAEVVAEPAPAASAVAPAEPAPAAEPGAVEATPVEAAAAPETPAVTARPAPPAAAEIAPAAKAAPKKVEAKAPAKKPRKAPVKEDEEEDDDSKARPKRMGKVTGFIDLSKIKTTQPRKAESRRLRSRDDVAPDVRPTMRHDKSRALLRGDRGARGQLSATELREREAARFLRRRGPGSGGQRGGGGGGGGRGGGPSRPRDENASPYSGSTIKVEEPVTVKKLAERLAVKPGQLLKVAFTQGGMSFGSVNINTLLDEDTAMLLAHEFDVELNIVREVEAEEALITDLKKKRTGIDEEELLTRPPTVAILGHVDHGKTTLVDSIRSSRVAEGEAGGITQHIGAYQVKTSQGHTLTILDTPGHEAFTAMRQRGAQAVDIVILVVAADDGVMPNTEEAINHARAAGTPIVVALTKMDKPEANPQKVVGQLAALDLLPEELGGQTAVMHVAAIKNQGVDELLERVFLESEVLELKCHEHGPASGIVLEAEVQQGQGIVAHLLIQDGTLNRGDIILAGEGYGKVRSMQDDRGKTVDAATPSMPVEVSGLSALPGVGEPFYVVEELARAKEVAEERERKSRAITLTERRSVDAQALLAAGGKRIKTINVIVRADVLGSVEALKQKLSALQHEEVEVQVLHAGVGAVTESDVLLGSTSDALLIAFHVGVNDKARQAAERAGLEIRYYEVIYELVDDMHEMMEGTLAPSLNEEVTGHVEIRRLFKSSKFGLIAGCYVLDGKVSRDSKARLMRDGIVVYSGSIASLRRESDDAKEVRESFECGLTLKDFQDVKEGDVVETYKVVAKKRTLADSSTK